VSQAKDLDTGVELVSHLLGRLSSLQVHHIFPKALLYKHNYSRPEVNAVANFMFLTQETNLLISDRAPSDYLPEFIEKQPGAVESHWVPMDPELWKVENYRGFLVARRELLAQAANAFLESLVQGTAHLEQVAPAAMEAPVGEVIRIESEEERLIRQCNEWVVSQGLPPGELRYELADPVTGTFLANIDLAWPSGVQEGYSQPVALLIDEDYETEKVVARAGYRCFTDIAGLHS